MVTKKEIDRAIKECENAPSSYQNCAKLATFYTIKDHMQEDVGHSYDSQPIVDTYGESEFMQSIQGKNVADVWQVMDELMEAVYVTNPRLYDSVMRKIKGQV